MFILTVASFLITTVDLAAQLAVFGIFIRGPLMNHIDLSPHAQLVQINRDIFVPDVIIEWATTILVCLPFSSIVGVFISPTLASAYPE